MDNTSKGTRQAYIPPSVSLFEDDIKANSFASFDLHTIFYKDYLSFKKHDEFLVLALSQKSYYVFQCLLNLNLSSYEHWHGEKSLIPLLDHDTHGKKIFLDYLEYYDKEFKHKYINLFLNNAVKNNNVDELKWLVDNYPQDQHLFLNNSDSYGTPIFCATAEGHVDVVDFLIRQNIEMKDTLGELLIICVNKHHEQLFDYYLENMNQKLSPAHTTKRTFNKI